MRVTLYHNPRCSKSRAALGLLRERGADVEVVEYLGNPPGPDALRGLLEALGCSAHDIVRRNETPYRELGLAGRSERDVLRAIAEHPILLQRPIALANGKAVIGRPPERVLELL